jgi:hypothetical protein
MHHWEDRFLARRLFHDPICGPTHPKCFFFRFNIA